MIFFGDLVLQIPDLIEICVVVVLEEMLVLVEDLVLGLKPD